MTDLLSILPPSDVLSDEEREAVASLQRGEGIALDLRGEDGGADLVEMIRGKLAAGITVGLWDSAGVVPPFALASTPGAYVVTDERGARGSFASVEAALKHGLTMWEGYRLGSR